MFCIPSRVILFNMLLICSFIKHSNEKNIYWNEWGKMYFFFFLNHEEIDKMWHAGQLSVSVGVSSFTLLSLEAVAPFIVRYQTVLVCVTRVEECLGTLFILIKVNASELWLVQQKVIVCIKSIKHPAKWILANWQNTGIKS